MGLALLATWVACSTKLGREVLTSALEPVGWEPPAAAERGVSPAAGPGDVGYPSLPNALERERGLEILREAAEQAAAGDLGAALRSYDAAAALLPAFAGWAQLLAAEAAAAAADAGEARRRLARSGEGPATEWAWRVEVRALVEVGDSAEAATVAERTARAAAYPAEAAAAWARAGSLRMGADTSAGLAALREAMRAASGSPAGLEAARAAYDLPGLAPDDRLLVGRTLLAHGGVDRGIPMLEAYLASGAGGAADRAQVQLEAGRTLFNARRYPAAERHLRAAAASHPEAALLLARTQYRQGRHAVGLASFAELSRRYPTSGEAADALFLLGDIAHDAGRISSAREYYRQAVATGAHSTAAADAVVRLAGIAIHAGDASTAIRDLNAYLVQRPRDAISAPAVYWLGRAQGALGDDSAARQRFREVLEVDPFSYYGMRAAERLGTALGAVELPAPPRVAPEVDLELEHTFFRTDLLRDLGLSEEPAFELARLQVRMREDVAALYAVAEGISARGQPIAGALLGRRIQQQRGVWDDRLLRIVYQFPYRELVVREAQRHGLDPFVVAGLIRQESFFNPVAVSPVGAIGLMQVMPETGRGLAARIGIAGFQPSMLRDPELNVRLGTLFLADQMRRWNQRESDVFAAYNAGPTRVARWRQFSEHRDDDVYVERIPIAETRDYVKRVRLNAQIYRRLYGTQS